MKVLKMEIVNHLENVTLPAMRGQVVMLRKELEDIQSLIVDKAEKLDIRQVERLLRISEDELLNIERSIKATRLEIKEAVRDIKIARTTCKTLS